MHLTRVARVQVIAFEPDARHVASFQAHPEVELQRAAAWVKDGELSFLSHPQHYSSRMLPVRPRLRRHRPTISWRSPPAAHRASPPLRPASRADAPL